MPETFDSSLPLVSILIPTHNRPEFFRSALESALAQTYPNIEIVISDNSDDDRTAELIKECYSMESRIFYKRNPGFSYVENWCWLLDRAKGEYFNYLFDDDLFAPQKIARMVETFQRNPGTVLVSSCRFVIDENGEPWDGDVSSFEHEGRMSGQEVIKKIFQTQLNLIGEYTTVLVPTRYRSFVRTPIARKSILADVESWTAILRRGDLYWLNEPLSSFRQHGGQGSALPFAEAQGAFHWCSLLGREFRLGQDPAQQVDLLIRLALRLCVGYNRWCELQKNCTRINASAAVVGQKESEKEFFRVVDDYAQPLFSLNMPELAFLSRFAGRADFTDRSGARHALLIVHGKDLSLQEMEQLAGEVTEDFDVCIVAQGALDLEVLAAKFGWSFLQGHSGEELFLWNTAVRLHPEAEVILRYDAGSRLRRGAFLAMLSCFSYMQAERRYAVGCILPLPDGFRPPSAKLQGISAESETVYTLVNYRCPSLAVCLLTRSFWTQLGGFQPEDVIREYCIEQGYVLAAAKKAIALLPQ